MTMRKWLEVAINDLKTDVNKMSNMVLVNISDSLKAFETSDLKLAKDIIKRDDKVDEMEELISKKALEIIWREQPLASDLRLVTGIFKLITDLERIGDHAIDIAKITITTHKNEARRLIPLTAKMANIAQKMVLNSVDAFFNLDGEKAEKTIELDDLVDDLFKKVITKTIQHFKKYNTDPEFAVYLIMVSKYIERVGDHAVNICEWIKYILSGSHRKTPLF